MDDNLGAFRKKRSAGTRATPKRTFRYFLLGESVPVRVSYNAEGLKMGAEAPDPNTGALVIRHALLRRVEESPEVDEITEDEFDRWCSELGAKRRH